MYADFLETLLHGHASYDGRLKKILVAREYYAFAYFTGPVACPADALDQLRDLPRGHVLDHEVYGTNIDTQLKGAGCYQGLEFLALELLLALYAALLGQGAVMD